MRPLPLQQSQTKHVLMNSQTTRHMNRLPQAVQIQREKSSKRNFFFLINSHCKKKRDGEIWHVLIFSGVISDSYNKIVLF